VVAVIMPDEGHRHANTVYNDQWLSSLPGWPCEAASEPEIVSTIEPRAEWEWTRFAGEEDSWTRSCGLGMAQQNNPGVENALQAVCCPASVCLLTHCHASSTLSNEAEDSASLAEMSRSFKPLAVTMATTRPLRAMISRSRIGNADSATAGLAQRFHRLVGAARRADR
jgi:hypothetical protein